jgi:hypothetical protein
MKINTREHTIVELPSTKGDVCFRERFFSMLEQKKGREKETEHGQ